MSANNLKHIYTTEPKWAHWCLLCVSGTQGMHSAPIVHAQSYGHALCALTSMLSKWVCQCASGMNSGPGAPCTHCACPERTGMLTLSQRWRGAAAEQTCGHVAGGEAVYSCVSAWEGSVCPPWHFCHTFTTTALANHSSLFHISFSGPFPIQGLGTSPEFGT